jgi:hypothetical protein
LWAREHSALEAEPRIINRLSFPKGSNGFMTSIVYVSKLKVFVAAALDMTFKLFSSDLKHLEVIPHEERAVLAMEYFVEDDIIVMAGARGVGVWRLWRPPKVGHSMQKLSYTMERMFSFTDIDGCWINGIQIDHSTAEVFAHSGNSAYVLSLQRRNVKHTLKVRHMRCLSCVSWSVVCGIHMH